MWRCLRPHTTVACGHKNYADSAKKKRGFGGIFHGKKEKKKCRKTLPNAEKTRLKVPVTRLDRFARKRRKKGEKRHLTGDETARFFVNCLIAQKHIAVFV